MKKTLSLASFTLASTLLLSCQGSQTLSNDLNKHAHTCQLESTIEGHWLPIVTERQKAPENNEGLKVSVVDPETLEAKPLDLSPAKCVDVSSLQDHQYLTIEYLDRFRFVNKVSALKERTQLQLEDFDRVDLQPNCELATFLSRTNPQVMSLTQRGEKDIFRITATIEGESFQLINFASQLQLDSIKWPVLELADGRYQVDIEIISLVSLPKFAGKKLKNTSCTLMIDNTPPSHQLDGLLPYVGEDGNESQIIPADEFINVIANDDNPNVAVEYCLVAKSQDEKICDTGPFVKVPHEGEWTLTVTTIDAAGNQSESTSYDFSVYDQKSIAEIQSYLDQSRSSLALGDQAKVGSYLLKGMNVYERMTEKNARRDAGFLLLEAYYEFGPQINQIQVLESIDAVTLGQNHKGDVVAITRNDFTTELYDLAAETSQTINKAYTRLFPSEAGNYMTGFGLLAGGEVYHRSGELEFTIPDGEKTLDVMIPEKEDSIYVLRSRASGLESYPFDGSPMIEYSFPGFGFYTEMIDGFGTNFLGIADTTFNDSILIYQKSNPDLWAKVEDTFSLSKLFFDSNSQKTFLVTAHQVTTGVTTMEVDFWEINPNDKHETPLQTPTKTMALPGMNEIENIIISQDGQIAISSKTSVQVIVDRGNEKSVLFGDQGLGEILDIAFLDAKHLYVLYAGGRSITWNTAMAKVVRSKDETILGISGTSISGNGQQLVLSSPDKSLSIISTKPSISSDVVNAEDSNVLHLLNGRNDSHLVSYTKGKLWISELGLDKTFPLDIGGREVNFIVPVGSNKMMIAFGDDGTSFFELKDGEWTETPFNQVKPANFAVQTKSQIVTVGPGRLDLWSLDGQWLSESTVNPFYTIRAVYGSPYENKLLLAYTEYGNIISDYIIVENGEITNGIFFRYNILDWVFFEDGRLAAVENFNTHLQEVVGESSLELADSSYFHRSTLSHFRGEASSNRFLSGSGDRTLKLWEGTEEKLTFVGHRDSISGLSFLPHQPNLYSSSDLTGTIFLWDSAARQRLSFVVPAIEGEKRVEHHFLDNGEILLVKDSYGNGLLFDLNLNRLKAKLCSFLGHRVSEECKSIP